MNKFKGGDKIRVAQILTRGHTDGALERVGKEGIYIHNWKMNDADWNCMVKFPDGKQFLYAEDELELIAEPTETTIVVGSWVVYSALPDLGAGRVVDISDGLYSYKRPQHSSLQTQKSLASIRLATPEEITAAKAQAEPEQEIQLTHPLPVGAMVLIAEHANPDTYRGEEAIITRHWNLVEGTVDGYDVDINGIHSQMFLSEIAAVISLPDTEETNPPNCRCATVTPTARMEPCNYMTDSDKQVQKANRPDDPLGLLYKKRSVVFRMSLDADTRFYHGGK